jgi:hypothetical protein
MIKRKRFKKALAYFASPSHKKGFTVFIPGLIGLFKVFNDLDKVRWQPLPVVVANRSQWYKTFFLLHRRGGQIS